MYDDCVVHACGTCAPFLYLHPLSVYWIIDGCGSKNVDVFVKVTGYCVEYDLHPFCQETQNLCEAGDAIGL